MRSSRNSRGDSATSSSMSSRTPTACRSGSWRPVQLQLGYAMQVQALGTDSLSVVGEPLLEIEGTYPVWLLVRDTEEGRRSQLSFADYAHRRFMGGRSGPWTSPHLAIVAIDAERIVSDDSGFPRRLPIKRYAREFAGRPLQRGERLLLMKRFTDPNTDRIVSFLEDVDRIGGGNLLPLLRAGGRRPPAAAAGRGASPRDGPGRSAGLHEQSEGSLRADRTAPGRAGVGASRDREDALPRDPHPGSGRGPCAGRASLPRPCDSFHAQRHRQPPRHDRPATPGPARSGSRSGRRQGQEVGERDRQPAA